MFAAGLFAAASAAAFAQAPATSSPATPQAQTPSSQQQTSRPAAGDQTVTGCLTSKDNLFTLTVMDDSGAPGTTVSTTAYTLAPGTGVDLQAHVNKMVTVKGTDAGPGMQNSTRVVEATPPAPAPTGTAGTSGSPNAGAARSGGSTPVVETEAKARINAKTLNVTSVQAATGECPAK
jgi:hypothetical protein